MSRTAARHTFAGIDVGKTKISAAVVTDAGRFISKAAIPTDLSRGGANVIGDAKRLLHEVISDSGCDIEGIGICWVGVVDTASGVIEYSSIKEASGRKIQKLMEEEFGVPALAGDDVTTPAYGEWRYGAGRGYGTVAYMTISTGAGMGIVKDGRLWKGRHNIAGILGPLEVYGRGHSIESAFSGKGIETYASRALGRKVSTEEAFRLSRDGVEECRSIIERAARTAASVVAGTQCLIDPDAIVIGGSVADNQPEFFRKISRYANGMMRPYRFKFPKGLRILRSELGQYNGILGAVGLLLERDGKS